MKTTKNLVKRISALAVIAIFGMSSLFAQKSGVYKTYSDYQAGKLTYGIDEIGFSISQTFASKKH